MTGDHGIETPRKNVGALDTYPSTLVERTTQQDGGSERLTVRDSMGNVRKRTATTNHDLTTNAQVRGSFEGQPATSSRSARQSAGWGFEMQQ
jgi:hypothetical protein